MNKKFLSAILFGALMLTSTGTFVSCKDYDDDIKDLQEQIDANKTAIAALDSQIKSGEWVSGVTSTANGIVVTLGNGTSYTITNGEAGKNGATPKIAVNNDKIQVSYDDGATWTDLIALDELKGEQGVPGETPVFSVGEDGHIYVQFGKDGEKTDLGVSTGGIYYVEEGVKLTIHIPNKEGEYEDIVLPRAAAISSIAALTVENGNIEDGATVTMGYGVAVAAGKYFDGTAFAKGAVLLPTKEASAELTAQINPTIADATVYDFYLADSKGASIFNLTQATANTSESALTRAATVNKGLYDMGITFVSGVTEAQINAANTADVAYAIATKDAYDNEVLSGYDVKVELSKADDTSFAIEESANVEINKAFDLNELVEATNLIDIQYYFAEGQTAAKNEAKASITGTSIEGKVAGKSVVVSVKYMKFDGSVVDTETVTINFIAPATENAYTKTLTLTGDEDEDILTFDLTGIIGNTVAEAPTMTIGNAKFTVATKDYADNSYAKGTDAVGITTGEIVTETQKTGYYKHTLTYAVDAATVIPGTYEAVITYGSNPVNSIKLTLVVNDPSAAFSFKPLELYFTGNNAVAYGTPNGTTIDYNLTGLFGISDWENISFSEVVPKEYKDADGVVWTANAWLSDDADFGAISVDKVAHKTADKVGVFGGAYEARALAATYVPFANKNLKAVKYEFNLTIKSAVYEGSLEYVKKSYKTVNGESVFDKYVAGDNKVIKVAEQNAQAVLNGDEIRGITKTAVTFFANDFDDAHVVSVAAALEGENAKQYLDIEGDFEEGYTITPKANVTIPSDGKSVTCIVRVSVVDEWGKTKTVDVPVVLQ